MKRLGRSILGVAALLAATAGAAAQVSVKLGVLNDRSGHFVDLAGDGSVIAAEMAAEDFGAAAEGLKVEVVSADHQNKADVGAAVVRRWLHQEGSTSCSTCPSRPWRWP